MNKEESTEEFANKRRLFGKPLITELSLRNTALVLALSCLISSAICINKITTHVQINDHELPMRTHAIASWIVFLSLVVLLYQAFAFVQLFLYIPPLYMKIPVRKSFWYLFPLIDIIVNIVCIIGYLPAVIASGVYTYQWIEPIVKNLQSDSISPQNRHSLQQQTLLNFILPVFSIFLFTLGSTVRFIVMIVFIFLAKFKFKWPNYFVPTDP